jgi:uracil-xanthine permease
MAVSKEEADNKLNLGRLKGAGWKKICFGDYEWGPLCMPQWPWCMGKRKRAAPPFYAHNEFLGIFLAAIMGLQHALAMVGGLITPPLVVSSVANDPAITRFLISSALIVSGICTIVHVIQLKIPFVPLYYGTGVISVIGISFTFLPLAQTSIGYMMVDGDTFTEAYGRLMGVIMVACLTTIAISFMPPRAVRRVFPPMVTGITIFLIGAALIGTGMKYWGGGVFCAENTGGLPAQELGPCVFTNTTTGTNTTFTDSFTGAPGVCYAPAFVPPCTGNGDVELPFGTAVYVGLGALVFAMLVFLELFGSPFLRNIEVVIALLFGYFIAYLTRHHGDKFVVSTNIHESESITFLWTKWFGIGWYTPALLPFIVSFIVVAVEGIGDITATEEASMLATTGTMHSRRIQGGLLGDGCNSFLGAIAMTLPSTTFAQNNGVIALTRCASRWAGIACGVWLICFGVLAKVGAWVTTIPDCVLGGMTTFLFANVCVSGFKVISIDGFARRTRFILAVSLGLGLGVTLVPGWATNNLWPITDGMSTGVRSLRDSVILILSNGFTIGCLTAIALHLILPIEEGGEDKYVHAVPQDPTRHGTEADREALEHGAVKHDYDQGLPPHKQDMHHHQEAGNNGYDDSAKGGAAAMV